MNSTPNTTCEIYRTGNAPPAAADVAGVACHLRALYSLGLEAEEGGTAAKKFTHVMDVAFRTDVRDAYDAGTVGATADTIYVPDKNGTPFKVVFVEGHFPGSQDRSFKRVYLARKTPTWPSQQL
jgi:hypothetical protein